VDIVNADSPTFAQQWLLDATGNWGNFKQDDDGDGTWNLDQDRTANKVNEITDISETTGPAWVTPVYSLTGNMTTVPQPADPTASYAAAFDAWNRLVKIEDGEDTVSEYAYDGTRRRIIQKSYTSGSLSEARHLYYTQPSQWQVLEERVGTSTDAERQFVWGLRYIDDCVLRDRDTNADGILDERLYALQDANWNVTTLTGAAGDVQERDAYSAYGVPLFLTPTFGSRAASSFGWETLYCGYRYETATGLFHIRNRVYHPGLGSWLQRDPVGYVDGMSQLAYARANSLNYVDPSGAAVGVQTKGYCCVRRAPFSPWCICVDWEVDFGAEFCCCRNGIRQTVGEFKVCVTVGYYICNSKNIGMSFLTQSECRVTPAKKRGGIGPVGTCRLGGCPPVGCSGRVCAQASVGYAAATFGARLCYGSEGYSFEFGYGIGTGTGFGGGGCINCVT
jgi:RHS repeat-associated protein